MTFLSASSRQARLARFAFIAMAVVLTGTEAPANATEVPTIEREPVPSRVEPPPAGAKPILDKAASGAARPTEAFDEDGLAKCLQLFQTYKSDPNSGRFQARAVGGRYRCQLQKPRRLMLDATGALPVAKPLGATMKGVSPRARELRYWHFRPQQKLDGQVAVTGISEYLGQASFNPDQTGQLTFVFDAQGLPEFTRAAVQFSESPYGNAANLLPGAKIADDANPCQNWAQPNGLVRSFFLNVTKAADAKLSSSHRQVEVQLGDMFKPMANHARTVLYVRVVPLLSFKGGGDVCLGGPTANAVVITAAMDRASDDLADAEKQQQAFAAQEAAQYANTVGADPRAKSPVTVQPLSFFPELVATAQSSYVDELVTIRSFHADYFPEGLQDYPIGCAFNVLQYNSVGPPRHWYDPVLAYIDAFAESYAIMTKFVVDIVETVVTLDQCKPTSPVPGVDDSAGTHTPICNGLRSLLTSAAETSLASVGLPPTLPTASEIVDDGLTWVATNTIDLAASYVPALSTVVGTESAVADAAAQTAMSEMIDAGRAALIDKTKESLRSALKLNACYFQSPPAGASASSVNSGPFDPTFLGWQRDPVSHCWTNFSEIYSYGTKNNAFYPRDAMLYIRVRKNPNGIALQDGITLKMSSGDYLNFHGSYANPSFAHDNETEIHVAIHEIPANGFVIPVRLPRSYAKFLDAAKQNCQNCLDLDQAEAAWYDSFVAGVATHITVSSEYVWSKQAVQPNGKASAARAKAIWLDKDVPTGKEIAFDTDFTKSARIVSPRLCPGFTKLIDTNTHQTIGTAYSGNVR